MKKVLRWLCINVVVIWVMALVACNSGADQPVVTVAAVATVPIVQPVAETPEANLIENEPSEPTAPVTEGDEVSTTGECPAETASLTLQYDEVNGYCFLYPVGSATETPNSAIFVVYGPALDESIEPVQAILTTWNLGPANGQTAVEVANTFSEPLVAAGMEIVSEAFALGGEPAILFPEFPGEISAVRQAIVVHNDTIYMLTVAPVGSFPQADQDVALYWQTAVSSFTFLP